MTDTLGVFSVACYNLEPAAFKEAFKVVTCFSKFLLLGEKTQNWRSRMKIEEIVKSACFRNCLENNNLAVFAMSHWVSLPRKRIKVLVTIFRNVCLCFRRFEACILIIRVFMDRNLWPTTASFCFTVGFC